MGRTREPAARSNAHPGDCHSFHKAEGRPPRCLTSPLPWQVLHCCEAEQMARPGLAGAGRRRRARGPSALHSSCFDLHELTITGSPTFPPSWASLASWPSGACCCPILATRMRGGALPARWRSWFCLKIQARWRYSERGVLDSSRNDVKQATHFV